MFSDPRESDRLDEALSTSSGSGVQRGRESRESRESALDRLATGNSLAAFNSVIKRGRTTCARVCAERFPPVLTIQQAAELLQVPVQTLYQWRSRELLGTCCRKVGKHLRFYRDRLIKKAFNEGLTAAVAIVLRIKL